VGGTSSPPNTYGAGGRAIKTVKDAAGAPRHTVDVFGTLRLTGATYDAGTNDYERTATTEKVFLSGLGRVVYDGAHALPSPSQSELHVFLAIGDHQGSTSVVIDLETSEVVEKATYLAFGAPDSDFRPERWGAHREDNRYTGKEDDIEVGLTYFGARYYSPYLHSWTQADPLTVQALGSDLNPYAFVRGNPARNVDPNGLSDQGDWTVCIGPVCAGPGGVSVGGSSSGGSGQPSGGAATSPTHGGGGGSSGGGLPPPPPPPASPAPAAKQTWGWNPTVTASPDIAGAYNAVLDAAFLSTGAGAFASWWGIMPSDISGFDRPGGDAAVAFDNSYLQMALAIFAVSVLVSAEGSVVEMGPPRPAGQQFSWRALASDTRGGLRISPLASDARAASGLQAQLRAEQTLTASGRISVPDRLELGSYRTALFDGKTGTLHVAPSGPATHFTLLERLGLPFEGGRYAGGRLDVRADGQVIFEATSGTMHWESNDAPNVLDMIRGTGVKVVW